MPTKSEQAELINRLAKEIDDLNQRIDEVERRQDRSDNFLKQLYDQVFQKKKQKAKLENAA